MRFELIGRTTAKLANVNVQALKLGQTELQPAITLRFKASAANTILDQLNPTLRTFLFIHGVRCFLACWGADDYRVQRWDTGAELARAPRRLLAIARAATLLHTPGAA